MQNARKSKDFSRPNPTSVLTRKARAEHSRERGEARTFMTIDSLGRIGLDWEGNCSGSGYKMELSKLENETEVATTDYRLHPNLISGNAEARIKLMKGEDGVVEIFDFLGVKVAAYSVSEGENTLSLNHFYRNGLFIYHVTVNGKLKTTDKLVFLD